MAARLPLWLREAERTFNLEKKNWYQDEFLPLIEKRNGFRSAECGQAPLSACTIQNTLVELKLFLLRHHGSKLISAEFFDWLQSQSPASESYDAKLLALIREQKDNPMGLLKLQREMAARLKKVPKKATTVDRQFVVLQLLKPAMAEVMKYASYQFLFSIFLKKKIFFG